MICLTLPVLSSSTLLHIPKRKNSLTSFGRKVAEGGIAFLSQLRSLRTGGGLWDTGCCCITGAEAGVERGGRSWGGCTQKPLRTNESALKKKKKKIEHCIC